ncbi:MAG: hypothetical protein WCL10_04195 [Novosphingobium sp.]|uniref:hypothetical protein n=1 Tax=Novosphingobium sp. TaxID=1874826 RepID=UPI0030175038
MNTFKIALTSAAALGLVISGTANAEATRAAGSFPGVVSKAVRTKAPKHRESSAVQTVTWPVVVIAVPLAGFAGFKAFEKGRSPD